MKRYVKRPEPSRNHKGWLSAGVSAAGTAAAHNPMAVGGATAFLVALAFVSANALWYQPQVHPSAFVSTRSLTSVPSEQPDVLPQPAPRQDVRSAMPEREEAESRPSLESTGSVAGGDAKVRTVQTVLEDLGLYRGPIDGMAGPQTKAAVESYRRIVGLQEGSGIDGDLLRQLGLEEAALPRTAAVQPVPKPSTEGTRETATASMGDPLITRVQAGLKAFGNDGIEIDGMMGSRTREAIREFQSLFRLPVTGEPDAALLAKMQEIGLTN